MGFFIRRGDRKLSFLKIFGPEFAGAFASRGIEQTTNMGFRGPDGFSRI